MKRRDRGVTMAEALIVVGIIAVLAGVAFVGIIGHLRKLTQLEYDGYAQEIYVAAQNHLSRAAYVDYLGRTGFGGDVEDAEGEYWFVLDGGGRTLTAGTNVQDLILPQGAVTTGGGYCLVLYHEPTARVLEVYYWSATGENGRFAYSPAPATYSKISGDYTTYRPSRSLGDPVIGRYPNETGGTVSYTPPRQLNAPVIDYENGERLVVYVRDTNRDAAGTVLLELWISSPSVPVPVALTIATTDPRVSPTSKAGFDYEIVLDDITSSGLGFQHLNEEMKDQFAPGERFTPGESITVLACARAGEGANEVEAYSREKTMSSLYADDSGDGTASIRCVRHLENLDSRVSGVESTTVSRAVQKEDLSWQDFLDEAGADAQICYDGGATEKGTYLPVNLPAGFSGYDGGENTVSDFRIRCDGSAGLFGTVSGGVEIKNLKLEDFTVASSSGGAGALVGSMTGGRVSNVLAVSSSDTAAVSVSSASGSAGGLIGAMSNVEVSYSAASLLVDGGSGTAGGLVGTANGGKIDGCYAAGHTRDGQYEGTAVTIGDFHTYTGLNVTGGTAGGLVGASSAVITNSYSTCSASGTTAGGFVGSMTGGSADNCYCTGLVGGASVGAFAGSAGGGASASNCAYYGIVNEYYKLENEDKDGYMPAGIDGASAFDDSVEHFAAYIGTGAAEPNDSALSIYAGRYYLKSLADLGAALPEDSLLVSSRESGNDAAAFSTHYGDWPSPEVMLVNTKLSGADGA